ncbi:uncharacterized protein K452DRAFT_159481 [Aplosporella prunicola CBS 121167]|uniref:Uncharacterized protein n=1 Tax=Aplosporella prunicola CBS 121167 TaxID=1176127 RepID=A0A6A6BM01_9PEZI|nr:uncharacterized protein K452DRAFT_159481 [Aplosporella prunicola CBS 121167]KAF2143571.1 hypothetical protein K452DRAFT_159481 [Aplosporella prunicola CBS 121167]
MSDQLGWDHQQPPTQPTNQLNKPALNLLAPARSSERARLRDHLTNTRNSPRHNRDLTQTHTFSFCVPTSLSLPLTRPTYHTTHSPGSRHALTHSTHTLTRIQPKSPRTRPHKTRRHHASVPRIHASRRAARPARMQAAGAIWASGSLHPAGAKHATAIAQPRLARLALGAGLAGVRACERACVCVDVDVDGRQTDRQAGRQKGGDCLGSKTDGNFRCLRRAAKTWVRVDGCGT